MKTISLLILVPCLASTLRGQLVGAFETFTYESNANTWNLYDEFTGEEGLLPFWQRAGSEEDPEIYGAFNEDYGISLYATSLSSDGYLVGDYTTAGVAGIFTNIFVEDRSTFDSFEFYFVSEGVFYYSNYFEVDFSGWSTAENSFRDDEWYIGLDNDNDGVIDEYVETPLTDAILGSVSEIGVTFFPILGSASDGKEVGLDNFTLLADLTPTEPILSVNSDSGSYSFEALPGTLYTVEQSESLRAPDWLGIDPPFEGDGSTYEHHFTTGPRNFFRVLTETLYTEVPEITP